MPPAASSLESFCGVFKRVLSTRHFDSLEPAPDHNIVVCVDIVPEEGGGDSRSRPARRYRWSFGPAVETARTGYVVEVLDAAIPAESADLLAGLSPLRVHFQGRDCYGCAKREREGEREAVAALSGASLA